MRTQAIGAVWWLLELGSLDLWIVRSAWSNAVQASESHVDCIIIVTLSASLSPQPRISLVGHPAFASPG